MKPKNFLCNIGVKTSFDLSKEEIKKEKDKLLKKLFELEVFMNTESKLRYYFSITEIEPISLTLSQYESNLLK